MKTSALTLMPLLGALALPFPARTEEPAAEKQDEDIPRIEVIGERENLGEIPGSGEVLSAEMLEAARVFNVSEALRKIPGLNPRDEEGFGLRPNVGVRGLNPTRSTKVTLLEDGIPLSYAPYGDNASYYHPPIDRYERIDVLKGSGQLLYGPQTVGAVIGYVTPTPTEEPTGMLSGTFGNRSYGNAHVRVGGKGLLLDYTRKQGDGARHNLDHKIDDLNLKALLGLGAAGDLILRGNHFVEDSMVTYSGLTDAELDRFGYDYNPFDNDEFDSRRTGLSLTHDVELGASSELITSLYYSYFTRDWWRQASTTTDNQGGLCPGIPAARAAGQAIDPDACLSRQGRLRDYTTYGIEPRLRVSHGLFGIESELETGVRAHFELQQRKQRNGTSPEAQTGTLVEDNDRDTQAYALFAQNRFSLGRMTVTPALRLESIRNERDNELTDDDGSDRISQWIPGLGVNYDLSDQVMLFAGAHRGFAPPRTEDVIDNTGTSTDVDAEESLNLELGFRARPTDSLTVDATYFRNDFERLIAVGSIAGGSTPLSEGKALFEGLELGGRWLLANGPYLQLAYTWLWKAEQSTPFRQVVNGARVPGSEEGNRQPYAPEHELAFALGFARGPFDAQIELVYMDEMYSDFRNTHTVAPLGNGQTGVIDSHTLFNLALNYELERMGTTLFFTVKNLGDREYIVDRTRGIQVGMPRLVQAGARYEF